MIPERGMSGAERGVGCQPKRQSTPIVCSPRAADCAPHGCNTSDEIDIMLDAVRAMVDG